MDTFVQQIINGLVLGSMYALVALGYTMVYGIINLINFAHGEVLMVGALTSWTVVTALADSDGKDGSRGTVRVVDAKGRPQFVGGLRNRTRSPSSFWRRRSKNRIGGRCQ